MKTNLKRNIELKETAKASLSGHSGVNEGGKLVKTLPVTMKELEVIQTPQETKFWHPVAHSDVPKTIIEMVNKNGWKMVGTGEDRFQMIKTETDTKLFGICKIVIPGNTDPDYQLALGFRNSFDKTLALRFAVGASVFVCSNLMLSGDIIINEIHNSKIDPVDMVRRIFEMIPGAAKRLTDWMAGLREIKITEDEGMGYLVAAVEAEALPIFSLMDARQKFLLAYNGENPEIQYGKTVWSVYNAITEQWKKHLLSNVQPRSEKLNELVSARTGLEVI